MKISKIEPQKRNKKRDTVYIEGKYGFGLSHELVIKFDLKEGDEISDELIKDFLLRQEKEKIRARAFKILRYRERSTQELRSRLLSIGFDQCLVDEIIEDFVRDNTLNDEKFAQDFIHDYTNLRPKGNRFISRELQKRGVSKNIISKLISHRDEKKLAKALIDKLSNLNRGDPKDRQKIIRRLLSRGFSPDIVYDTLNEYDK